MGLIEVIKMTQKSACYKIWKLENLQLLNR